MIITANQDLIPIRMVNEYAYCPRLYYLIHVDGEWEDNVYTIEGKHTHRRADAADSPLPEKTDNEEEGDPEPEISRSVTLSSEKLGIVGKLDLVETTGKFAMPVETKRGTVPNNPERSWEPERVQLMAQGMLLREHGYICPEGVLYFAGSRTRVTIPLDNALEEITNRYILDARSINNKKTMPPPLDDSPKCKGCSLAPICLPDETLTLQALDRIPGESPVNEEQAIRRFYPARDDALPFYVQEQGAYVGKKGKALVVRLKGEDLAKQRLKDTSQLVLCGNIQVSTQAMHTLCEAGIPIIMQSTGGWFYGITHGHSLRNGYDRAAQYEMAANDDKCLSLAKSFVAAKASNQRTMLRRNGGADKSCLDAMRRLISASADADNLDILRGVEGSVAREYFQNFASMLRNDYFSSSFQKAGRNRRPPTDPVNAMLSYGYALLVKECTVALLSANLDPYWGFLHKPKHGKPALALDLMEEFRALIADSAVLTAINSNMVKPSYFASGANGCVMSSAGRKAFIRAWEMRMDQLVTHPVFDYKCSWRRIVNCQARLLARFIRGDIPAYPGMITR